MGAHKRVDEKADEIIAQLRKHFRDEYRAELVTGMNAHADHLWRMDDPSGSFAVQFTVQMMEAGKFDGK